MLKGLGLVVIHLQSGIGSQPVFSGVTLHHIPENIFIKQTAQGGMMEVVDECLLLRLKAVEPIFCEHPKLFPGIDEKLFDVVTGDAAWVGSMLVSFELPGNDVVAEQTFVGAQPEFGIRGNDAAHILVLHRQWQKCEFVLLVVHLGQSTFGGDPEDSMGIVIQAAIW